MAELIDGKKVAAEIREEIRREVAEMARGGVQPGLVAVRVGDNPASAIYVRNKRKACEAAGIYSEEHHLPADIQIDALLNLIADFNKNPKINVILVQLPLPGHLDADRVIQALSPDKDVDGLHAFNVGRLTMGRPRFVPCTPAGVIELLLRYKIPIEGQRAVVVGRSNLVGRPAALLLMHRNATVTVCHSRTRDIAAVARQAEILIAAIGKPRFVTSDMVKSGAAVIDVGINRLPDGKLAGDVDFDKVEPRAGWITPVPGGVGPMTIAMLLRNTVDAAKGK
jgi:methylenetetrahydrofolate dehydrogenase (NADP+)/methenyltetrahydrofolate cyclohydrolase